ncbi:MAG: hypothetical protein HRU28_13025 [Rhizobiales bacterium]|nr:hypothetical protein [Hyphomicrobiales bacterium]
MIKTKKLNKLGNFFLRGFKSHISNRFYFNTQISDQQHEAYPEQQLHEYVSILRARMWQ